MKYIVVEVETSGLTRHLPIIFPEEFVHDDVYKAICRNTDDSMIVTGCVSAGFLNSFDINARCHGESTSIPSKSKESFDDNLIKMIDYTKGLIL